MRYRPLGSTGLEVSEIGFGGWGIGRGFWKGGDDAESARALDQAAAAGVNLFDTALGYGGGHGERLVGALVKRYAGRLLVATKVPPLNRQWPARGHLAEAFPREHIVASLEASRRNLQQTTLDLVQLHVWHPDWLDDPQWHDVLMELREKEWLRFIGVSCNDHDPASVEALVRSGRIDAVQVIYNIFDPAAERRLFPLCSKHGVGILGRVALDEGGLTGQLDGDSTFPRGDWRSHYFTPPRLRQLEERVEALRVVSTQEQMTLPELALRFCLAAPAVSSVLVGMRQAAHVRANAGVSDGRTLTKQLLEQLRLHQWKRNFYAR